LEYIATYYKAQILTLPEKNADVIVNDWVKKATEGKIEKIVGELI
jgi:hypothetical protein